ncbi:MAG: hypothetical protein HYS23_00605 [Geobacter sp.]|nr:hypothetical protein [Geobacter sp.]
MIRPLQRRTAKKVMHLLAVAASAAILFSAGSVWAQNPHFVGTVTAKIQPNGSVNVKFKEAGLGSNVNIDYVASADVTAVCVCVTNSGQCPNAENKKTTTTHIDVPATISSGKNGTVSATLNIPAPGCGSSAPPTCGGGQSLILSEITWTNIKITDTTNVVSAFATPATLSKTLFTCP